MSNGETSIQTGSSYREAVSTWNVALENVSDLHVTERQEIRHYRAGSTEEERQMAIFYFARRASKLRYYGNVIHSFYWKSAVEPDDGV